MRITKRVAGHDEVADYTYLTEIGDWTMVYGGVTEMRSRQWNDRRTEFIETHTSSDAEHGVAGTLQRHVRQMGWTTRVLTETVDPDGARLVTRYTYYDDPTDPRYTFLRSVEYPNGRWKILEYDALGRKSRILEP